MPFFDPLGRWASTERSADSIGSSLRSYYGPLFVAAFGDR